MRKRLPAYAKELLDRRRAGERLLQIDVCYGDRWRAVPSPAIALMPAEYEPGRYDFSVLAGLRVVLHDQLGGGWEVKSAPDPYGPAQFGKFYDLVREIAVLDTWLTIRWPANTDPPEQAATDVAWVCRSFNHAERKWRWPAWWSDAINDQQFRRARQWLVEAGEKSERDRAAA